ncbi:nicotinamidase, partial [Propionibacterium freudenreichii]|nr:nicotinamidase [Propionibacterium freudenreichii]
PESGARAVDEMRDAGVTIVA